MMGLKTREMGWSRAIVVAATGIGKTYLAAFDSGEYKKVLFVAHREEILNQAAATFYSVRPECSTGFFSDGRRDMNCDITFATVQTIGKKEYLMILIMDRLKRKMGNMMRKSLKKL